MPRATLSETTAGDLLHVGTNAQREEVSETLYHMMGIEDGDAKSFQMGMHAEGDIRKAFDETIGVDRHADPAADAKRMDDLVEHLPDLEHVPIDRVSKALIRHCGLQPGDLLIPLSIVDNGEVVLCLSEDTLMMIWDMGSGEDRVITTSIQLVDDMVPDVTWDCGQDRAARITICPSLPATLESTLRGRPLRDVISHPVLDLFDLTILEIDPNPDGDDRTRIHLKGHPGYVAMIGEDE